MYEVNLDELITEYVINSIIFFNRLTSLYFRKTNKISQKQGC